MPVTASGVMVPVNVTRTEPGRPSFAFPAAVNDAPSGVEPVARMTML